MFHTFDREGVNRLIAHTKAATRHRTLRRSETPAPGLWLVGDAGVYLMSNGDPGLLREPTSEEVSRNPDGPYHFVVYAYEVDPTRLDFDTWWNAKRAGFGADDGVEFLPLADIEAALAGSRPDQPLLLDVSATGISILRVGKKLSPRKKPATRKPTR